MNYDNSLKPLLVEPGVRSFLSASLKQCNAFKNTYNNVLWNIGLAIALVLIVGIVLIWKYRGKLTPIQLESKNLEKQQYIVSKIQNYQESKRKAQQELITGLPHWD